MNEKRSCNEHETETDDIRNCNSGSSSHYLYNQKTSILGNPNRRPLCELRQRRSRPEPDSRWKCSPVSIYEIFNTKKRNQIQPKNLYDTPSWNPTWTTINPSPLRSLFSSLWFQPFTSSNHPAFHHTNGWLQTKPYWIKQRAFDIIPWEDEKG